MILFGFLILSSVLLGSALGSIFAQIFFDKTGVNFFTQGLSQNIPTLDLVLAKTKTLDVLNFSFFLIVSFLVFGAFYFIYHKRKFSIPQQIILGGINVAYAIFLFFSIAFASYSGVQTLIFTFIWYGITFALSFFLPKDTPTWKEARRSVLNGVVVGFYLLIVLNNLTTSIAFPLAAFAGVPLFFFLFSKKVKLLENPSIALLFLSFVFPFSRIALIVIAAVTAITLYFTNGKVSEKLLSLTDKVYPALIVFLFAYNPVFYLGNFDSIEEGFWAGWLQRLIGGQIIYKDFAAYHPPFLLDGLYIFTRIFGYSLFNLRLYFHLLQVGGLIVIYYALSYLVESKWIRLGIFALILSYTEVLVRNNMEARIGSALLPLLFVYSSIVKKQAKLLFFAGIFSGAAFLISTETGAGSLIAVTVAVVLMSQKKTIIKNISLLAGGILAVAIPFTLILIANGGLNKFLEYLIYYTSAFSQGYLNTPMDTNPRSTLVQWYIVTQYINASGFVFLLSGFSIVAGICLYIVKKLKKELSPEIILVAGISVLTLVISRSALGRSDNYHINFVWTLSLILVAYFLQKLRIYSKDFATGLLVVLIFFIARDVTQNTLVQNQLIKFQTYGNPSGGYPSYSINRAGIITGIDVNPKETDDLVKYVDSNVSPNEKIFAFPQGPEMYFLTDRMDATSFDTPLAFFTPKYQEQMIKELMQNPPKLIIYGKDFQTQFFTADTLKEVNKYILANFHVIQKFGKIEILTKN